MLTSSEQIQIWIYLEIKINLFLSFLLEVALSWNVYTILLSCSKHL